MESNRPCGHIAPTRDCGICHEFYSRKQSIRESFVDWREKEELVKLLAERANRIAELEAKANDCARVDFAYSERCSEVGGLHVALTGARAEAADAWQAQEDAQKERDALRAEVAALRDDTAKRIAELEAERDKYKRRASQWMTAARAWHQNLIKWRDIAMATAAPAVEKLARSVGEASERIER